MPRFATKDNLKTIVDALRDEMPDATSATPNANGTASAGTSDDYARADHVHPTDETRASTDVATTSTNGLMSSTDKTKLNGIASGATANTAASATPKVDGTAAVGTSAKYAREDHVHPTDTTRAAASDLTSHTDNTTVHITAAERTAWNAKTSNTGTVTSVATGAGLTGGTITGSGTIKADLKSETKSMLEAASMGSTASRQYAVGLDKNGDLSVNVPWEDTKYTAASTAPKVDGTATVGSSTKYAREDHVHPTDTTRMAASLKGAASGVAELDENGKVPSSQLPSYVDDVLEYSAQSAFPATGESGKIYVDLTTNKTYRWSGSAYTEISPSLALGETSATAYRGDRGKTAYDHAAAKGSAFSSGLYKITTNAQGHVTAATAVAKDDITGLGIPAQDTTYTAASTAPKVDGTAAVGTSAKYAREDHVHPTDTTRAAASDLTSHTGNTTVHITAAERTKWNQQGIEYIMGTHGTTATNVWTGVTTDSALYVGKCIAFYLTSAGTSTAATLNLTLSGGGTTGAKNVRFNNTNVTTHYGQYTVLILVYDGTYWRTFDYNSDTVNRIKYDMNINAAEVITNGRLICGSASGYRNIAAGLSFSLEYPLLYAGSAIAKGATTGTRNNNFLKMPNINFSANGTITSGGANKAIFIKGTLSGNMFTIASAPFFTTVVPTSADGFAYIPIGIMTSATNGYFDSSRDVMAYVDGKFQKALPTEQLGGVNIPIATVVPTSAFKNNSVITTVDLSTCVVVGDYAFQECSALTSVSLPACTTVGVTAFQSCSHLTSVSLPVCTTIGDNAFARTALTSVSLQVCETLGGAAFFYCSSLSSVNLPMCTTVKAGTFGSTALTSVNLPACTTIGDGAFQNCASLTSVSLPACTTIGNAVFQNCDSLTSVSLPVCTTIEAVVFGACYNLVSLYLTSVSKVPTLGANAFMSTPIGGYIAQANRFGSVYVPMSLLAEFKTAPNWSSIASRIVGVGVDDIDNSTIKRNSNGQLYVDIPSLMGVSY